MTERSFPLIPFPASHIPKVTLTGTIARQDDLLALHYSLAGNVEEIFLPPPSAHPGRRDELWQTTCFEFFLAIKDQPQYWEFNLSPSGDWNVYHMDAYRRLGFREETSIQRLPFEGRTAAGTFTLEVTVDVAPILPTEQEIEAGITAVIQTRNGDLTYWALAHPASQADFHARKSFILRLAGQPHP